jgi:hypothetical protein
MVFPRPAPGVHLTDIPRCALRKPASFGWLLAARLFCSQLTIRVVAWLKSSRTLSSSVPDGAPSFRVGRPAAALYRPWFVSLPFRQFPTDCSGDARVVDFKLHQLQTCALLTRPRQTSQLSTPFLVEKVGYAEDCQYDYDLNHIGNCHCLRLQQPNHCTESLCVRNLLVPLLVFVHPKGPLRGQRDAGVACALQHTGRPVTSSHRLRSPMLPTIQGHILIVLVPVHPFFERDGSLEILRRQPQRLRH